MKTNLYEFSQNNSGGSFDVDDNVCHTVFIEAETAEQAMKIFEPMIVGQSGSCPCCGDRWCTDWGIDAIKLPKNGWDACCYVMGTGEKHKVEAKQKWHDKYGKYVILEEPKYSTKYGSKQYGAFIQFTDILEYLQFIANEYGFTTPDIRIHYLDGTKKEIFSSLVDAS